MAEAPPVQPGEDGSERGAVDPLDHPHDHLGADHRRPRVAGREHAARPPVPDQLGRDADRRPRLPPERGDGRVVEPDHLVGVDDADPVSPVGGAAKLGSFESLSGGFLLGMLAMYVAVHLYRWK